MTLPEPGQRIRVRHHCGDARTGTVHDEPVEVVVVTRLHDGRHRIETARCDGGAMNVYEGADVWEIVRERWPTGRGVAPLGGLVQMPWEGK